MKEQRKLKYGDKETVINVQPYGVVFTCWNEMPIMHLISEILSMQGTINKSAQASHRSEPISPHKNVVIVLVGMSAICFQHAMQKFITLLTQSSLCILVVRSD